MRDVVMRAGETATEAGGTGMHSCYRPQTKFAKVMFLHLSVSHSVHSWGSTWAGTPSLGRYTPQAGTPPGPGTPPRRRLLLRTVRTLLECILVYNNRS